MSESSKQAKSVASAAEDRGTWTGRLDFTMSALSFAVGMGNLWRFPYLCYRGGGGAFLIPYVIAMIVAGYPLMLIELALGQYGRQGIVSIWKACPLFQGIGWGMFAVSLFTGIYYNMIIAWCFFYLFASFGSDVPWKNCDHVWNSAQCATSDLRYAMMNCTNFNGTYNRLNNTCEWLPDERDAGVADGVLDTAAGSVTKQLPVSPTDDFFHNYMLDISGGLHEMGYVRWQLALCLLLCWVIVFLSLAKGIKVSGKVTYVTALLPYAVLLILLVRGVTLNGSMEGILYYVTPQWDKLASAQVWGDAAVQVFFSLSLCWGGLITLASYNKFDNDCLRDTVVVATGDMLTSIFGGFVTFSILGFMAAELRLPIDEVATHGPGLVFIVYPEGIAQLPISPLWSILFMLMLLNVGIGSQMGIVSTVHTTLLDMFPQHLATDRRKLLLLLTICVATYFLGLSLCTQGGMYMLTLLDNYSATYSVLLLAVAECIALSWFYGLDRFYSDIQQMIGRRISVWWKICWKFLSPAFVVFILMFKMYDFNRTSYKEYVFPVIWDVLGWSIPLLIVLCIPLTAITKLLQLSSVDSHSSLKQKLLKLSKPTADWGNQNGSDYSQRTTPIGSDKVTQDDNQVKHATTQL